MATEVFCHYSTGRGLTPATAADAEAMEDLAGGVTYRAVITRAQGRSVRHNRFLFGLIKIARENYAEPISSDSVKEILKLRTGHVRVVQLASGEMVMLPKSISFENMDQDAFNAWFPRAVDVLCRDFCPGLERELAMREIEKSAGERFTFTEPAPVDQREGVGV